MVPAPQAAGLVFTVGQNVEVCFDKESCRDCWFPATILENSDNKTCQVEYLQLGSNDMAVTHKLMVDHLRIRPSPPHLRVKNFVLLEKVDAFYDFGWWNGVITKELGDNRYNVFFKHSKKERAFLYPRLRPHMEWKDGKWLNTSQGDRDGRMTHASVDKQIEQTTPSVDKQSSIAASILKKTRQENLDSNGKGSPPSKKLQDEITTDDFSKKTNHQSANQSEGFDSEVSGTAYHAFGKRKTENLSHGKKVRSNSATNLLQKQSIEKSPEVTGSDAKQPIVPFLSMIAVKEGGQGDAVSVAPKRKRGRPPKLLSISPKTPVTSNNQKGGVLPSAPLVVEGGQNAPLIKDKLPSENSEQDIDVQPGQETKKYSTNKEKQRTISINTVPTKDSQDASKGKTDGSLEKVSATRNPEASVGKPRNNVLDNRPLTAVEETKDLPFVKNTSLWKTLESMETFRTLPQKPHFRPLLQGVKESAREGLAIGTMVTFSIIADKTRGLRFTDPRSAIEESLETLAELENNGFDVKVIRDRLTRLLLMKDKQEELAERSKQAVETIAEHNIQVKSVDEEIEAFDRQIRELQDKRKQVLLKKEKMNTVIHAVNAKIAQIELELRGASAVFDGLVAAHF